MNITLLSIEHGGKVFGAGACIVTLGGFPIDAIACRAGEEKWITNERDAVEWLAERGLPKETATSLVADAKEQS